MKNTMIKVVEFHVEESNGAFNPNTCHNGGGYHQPIYTIKFNDGVEAILCDESCGDFGTRYSLTMRIKSATWGSMLDNIYSDFTVDDLDYLEKIQKVTGIFVPINEDLIDTKEEEDMYNSKNDEKFYAIVELLDERTRVRMEEEGVMPLDMDEDEENFWFAEAKSYIQDKEKDWEILLEYYPWLAE